MDMFMPIIPRHTRLLQRLVEQKKNDKYGMIGWRGLMDAEEPYTIDQLFKPLLERGLVEDLSKTEMGGPGIYFVRITPMGEHCLSLGYMLKAPRPMNAADLKTLPAEVTA
jgi:hypothetical protein